MSTWETRQKLRYTRMKASLHSTELRFGQSLPTTAARLVAVSNRTIMISVKAYNLPPTASIPNNPYPLLHYTGNDLSSLVGKPAEYYDLFSGNDWQVQWIYRYGPTQRSHYHSGAHECMAVLSGTATIRFGVADTSLDMTENTSGNAREAGGIEIEAKAGDVFVLPAGTAHKTYNTKPEESFTLLTPGTGHGIDATNAKAALSHVQLSGFTMIGAYPRGSGFWDSMKGGEDVGQFERVWSVEKPKFDPLLGESNKGLRGLWMSKGAQPGTRAKL